ncbi:hypothetical protein BH23BAC1_BH23BAC1_49650 [soil metagenome]
MNKSFKTLFFLKKGRGYKNGPMPIYVRITVDGEKCETSTQRKCDPAKWNQSTGRAKGTKASSIGDRIAVQWIKDGVIGKIKHAYLCSNRPQAIETYRLVGPRPIEGQEPPSKLDWDLWIGTAPLRPYAPEIYHPSKWRAWQDFGTGWSGDIGCHIFDAVWKGLGLKAPTSIVAEVQKSWQDSPERRNDTWPQGDHITWIFPGNNLTESSELPLEWLTENSIRLKK